MNPEDAAETLLLAQMAAIHQATMMMARRLKHVENIPQQDAAERALNKLGRTFAAQMDTLKRYRTKGQQTVRVERVTVNEGGQAIVGDVRHGGRGGAQPGPANPNWRHGGRSGEAMALRKKIAELTREAQEAMNAIEGSGPIPGGKH
ncbi:hypothetical protein [Antarcticimicrobium sp.]|uniref:hypothetical protein n=1 Tax=Antarcticimicrobium sp. TaxID=2824147 RepID=UPI00261EA90D|nr:hypothetical protein [Antarcticimicrobium sp.]